MRNQKLNDLFVALVWKKDRFSSAVLTKPMGMRVNYYDFGITTHKKQSFKDI